MNGKPFFDTNVLIYTIARGDARADLARELLRNGGVISTHVLNEFVAVVRRKFQMPWKEVLEALADFRELCPEPKPVTLQTHETALKIAERYGYHIYDSLMIANALEASCGMLYSEDMRDGQVIDGLTIRNPFPQMLN